MPTLQQRRLLLGGSSGLVTAGLAALWMPALDYFPGIAAQTVTDRSGSGNALTLGSTGGVDANDPAWSQQGLTFSGTGQYALTGAPVITKTDNFAFEAVFLRSATSLSDAYVLYNGVRTTSGYGLLIASATATLRVLFGGIVSTDLGVSPTLGTWYDVVVTRTNGVTSAWINGAQVGVTWANTPVAPATRTILGSSDTTKEYLTGGAAYVAYYNHGLSGTQIGQNHRWLRAQLTPAGIALP